MLLLVALLCACACAQEINTAACDLPVRPLNVFCSNDTGSTGGVLAVSSVQSCSYYQDPRTGDTLACNGEPMTVLDISIPPGSGQTITYRFVVASEVPPAGSSTVQFPGDEGRCPTNGNCIKTRPVRLEVTTSDYLVFYQMSNTGLDVPCATAAFHTNNYEQNEPGDQCQPIYEGGVVSDYKVRTPKNNVPRSKEGVMFSGYAAPPIEPLNPFFPFSWQMASVTQLMGVTCRQPLNPDQNAFDLGAFDCRIDINGYQCSAINPDITIAGNYSLQLVPGGSAVPTLPFSPFSTPNVYAPASTPINPYAVFADDFFYEDTKSTTARWESCLRKYSGRLSKRSPARVWAGTYFYQGLVRNDQYYYQWTCTGIIGSVSCLLDPLNVLNNPTAYKVGDIRPVIIGFGYGAFFTSTDMLWPVPTKNGGKYVPGKDPCPVLALRTDQQAVCSTDDDDCVGEAGSIIPMPSEDEVADTGKGSTGSNIPRTSIAVCQGLTPPNTFTGFVSNLIRQVFSLDNGIQACSLDRIGMWETASPLIPDWLGNEIVAAQSLISYIFGGTIFGSPTYRDTFSTADTMGTLGPTCRVWDVRPAAIPQYAVRAVLYDDTTGEVLENITVYNVGTQNVPPQANNTNDDSEQLAQDATQSPEPDPQSTLGANRLMFVDLTGFETVTGSVAPDFLSQVVVCNTTDANLGMFTSDRDPVFGIPSNPWVTNNNDQCQSVNPPVGCRDGVMTNAFCQGSGKVPLPQCLAAKPQQPGAPYNPYAWWYTIPPRKRRFVGRSCGQIGFSQASFNEKTLVRVMCQSARYTCVPGWIPGTDWTLEERLRDQLNTTQRLTSITGQVYQGSNSQERVLRDSMVMHMPCVVSGYLREWSELQSCQAFLDAASRQGYLPDDWVVNTGDSKCSLPNYWVDGSRLYRSSTSQTNTLANIRLRVGIVGTLAQVEATVSSGIFVVPADGSVACAVQQGGAGQLQLVVQNTGTLVGRYRVSGNCSNGVQVLPLERDVPPGASQLFQLGLRQTGFANISVVQGSSCTFLLDNPSFPQLRFDLLQDRTCQVLLGQASRDAVSGVVNFTVCDNTTGLCTTRRAPVYQGDSGHMWASILLFVLGLLAIMTIFGCVGANVKILNN